MASLYKKPVTVTDRAGGRKVKGKSKKWWGQYKDSLGQLKRVPLATNKATAQAMLNKIVERVEREKAGLVDPTEAQQKRPLTDHIREFGSYLRNKGVGEQSVWGNLSKLRWFAIYRKWGRIRDISASGALEFLGYLRRKGRSAQTYNHYLATIKQFTRWLVRDRRTLVDPLMHLSRLNVRTDRRHDRRPLSQDEFVRLVDAARCNKRYMGIRGKDRAMLYVLAAWTGFRKGEIGSLTLRSLRLDDDPPTATVAAGYSKRRQEDVQVLHPEVVRQLRDWLATKPQFKPHQPLFPISGRVPGGKERGTSLMMERDLKQARKRWIEEAQTEEERKRRLESDFLCYRNHDGLFADFHSLRHRFITGLAYAGVSPKIAQTLARHSDIQLTMNIYTHVGLHDQTAAIQSLPAPPSDKPPILSKKNSHRSRFLAKLLGDRKESVTTNAAMRKHATSTSRQHAENRAKTA